MKKIFPLLFVLLLLPFVIATSGNMKILAVSNSGKSQMGSIADLFLEIEPGKGRVFIDSFPLSKLDTQISTRFAKEIACNFLEVDCSQYDFFYTIRANSPIVGGPSASAAITILTISVLEKQPLDKETTITGTINSGGIIGPVGGIIPKIKAASKQGIKKVLIPRYSSLNFSNISELSEQYSVEIIEVSHITEALREMTGKDYSIKEEIEIQPYYVETMKKISEQLCRRAINLANELYENFTKQNNTAINLLDKGLSSINDSRYYSAASYCFGSNINLRYQTLLRENLDEEKIRKKISETRKRVSEFKNSTSTRKLKTITDLEAYMVVNDRLDEAKEHLNNAFFNLAIKKRNTSLRQLALGIERLSSALSWSEFFNKQGREFNINKKALKESCLKKISEVEERIQYIELFVPSSTEEARKSVRESYDDYNNNKPEQCLYKSSIAKAKIDLILNSMALDPDKLNSVIEDRLNIVKAIIAKQNKRNIFPLLAYSYYEYANSLKETDPYSALLYLEYALELGSLDIYFEKKSASLPKIDNTLFTIYFTGLITGIAISLLFILIYRLAKRKKKR